MKSHAIAGDGASLADAIGPEQAQRLYQDFKWKVVARLDQKQPWEITREHIQAWVSEQRGVGR